MQRTTLGAITLISILASMEALTAATVTWSAATTIGANTDVDLVGTLDRAYNFGNPGVQDTTINGVTFVAAPYGSGSSPFPAMPDSSLSVGALSGASNDFGSSAAPFSNMSSEYQLLLSTGIFTYTDAALSLTLNNLTVGSEYRVQMWTNWSQVNGYNKNTTFFGSTNVNLEQNIQNDEGGLGQFAIGTFVADSTSQVIQLQGYGSSTPRTVLNAFQLRAVPEPGATTAFGLVALYLAAAIRRRRC